MKRKQVVFLSFVILAINPGSTSTKAGLFDGAQALWTETVRHDPAEIAKFPSVSADLIIVLRRSERSSVKRAATWAL